MSETLKIVVPWFDSKCTECVARGCVQVPTIYLPVNHPLNQKQVSTNDPDLTVTPPVVDRCMHKYDRLRQKESPFDSSSNHHD